MFVLYLIHCLTLQQCLACYKRSLNTYVMSSACFYYEISSETHVLTNIHLDELDTHKKYVCIIYFLFLDIEIPEIYLKNRIQYTLLPYS